MRARAGATLRFSRASRCAQGLPRTAATPDTGGGGVGEAISPPSGSGLVHTGRRERRLSRANLIAAQVPHTEPIGRKQAAFGRGSSTYGGMARNAALDPRREARAAPSGSGLVHTGRRERRRQQSELDRGPGTPHRAYRAETSSFWAGEQHLRWDGPERRPRPAERGQSGA